MQAQQAAGTLAALSAEIEKVRRSAEERLKSEGRAAENKQARRVLGNRAAGYVTALRNTLRNWYSFYDSYDPLFTWWTAEPYRSTDTALQAYAVFLREKVALLPATPDAAADASPGEAIRAVDVPGRLLRPRLLQRPRLVRARISSATRSDATH